MIKVKLVSFWLGDSKIPAERIGQIVKRLDSEIDNLISKGVTNFISGGAVGFDLIATSLIVAKKEMGQDVRLIFVLPFKGHDALWDDRNRRLFKDLLKEADEVIYVSEQYSKGYSERWMEFVTERALHSIRDKNLCTGS